MVLTGIDFVENIKHEEYMEKTCSIPGTSCPLEDPWYLLPFEIPGLVFLLFGTYLISLGQVQKKK
jgi:disulfide bond formation protein DsbB